MNEKRLRIYLDDHLALMVGEAELVNRCLGSNQRTSLGDFLQKLANEAAGAEDRRRRRPTPHQRRGVS